MENVGSPNLRDTHRWTVRLPGDLVVTGVTGDSKWMQTVTSKVGTRDQTKQSKAATEKHSSRETYFCIEGADPRNLSTCFVMVHPTSGPGPSGGQNRSSYAGLP